MKRVILLFSIFLISLIIGCSVEAPVTVSTTTTGEEDLTGLGTQYAYLLRMKISQLNESGEYVEVINHYSKLMHNSGGSDQGLLTTFFLDNGVGVKIEETVIWAIPYHGYTYHREARFDIVGLPTDTMDIPNISIDSRGFRKKERYVDLGNGKHKLQVSVGHHPNYTPIRTALSLNLVEGEDIIAPIFKHIQYFELLNEESGETWTDMLEFITKKAANPLNYSIVVDAVESAFQVSRHYCCTGITPTTSQYFSEYTSHIYVYDLDVNPPTVVGYISKPLGNFNISCDPNTALDYQGDNISTFPSLNSEKHYGIKMGITKNMK